MNYRAKYLLISSIFLLTACASSEQSLKRFKANPTSNIVLHQTMTIPAESASVYLQFGRVMPKSQIDIYYPNCVFRVRSPQQSNQLITADTFAISNIYREENMHLAFQQPQRYAALNLIADSSDSGFSGNMNFVTRFKLFSSQQPKVLSLSCSHWIEPYENTHLSQADIQKVLGDTSTLNLNP